jgi:hypothetical protein
MPDDRVLSAIAQHAQLQQERYGWEDMWQQIADHMVGRRDFSTIRTPGDRRMGNIHDITALLSGELLAGALHSLMTNSASKWFRLGVEDPDLANHPDVRLWTDQIAEPQMYNAINRPEAGFNPQMHEVYFNLTLFCTAAVSIDEELGRGAVFSSRPLMEIFIAEDPYGRIDTVFRNARMTARQAKTRWGEKAPKKALELVTKDKPEEKIDVLQAIRPNLDQKLGRLDHTGMPWSSFYIDSAEKTMIDEGGFWELPIMVARWSKDAGERYGRGPGITALADAKMLNAMWKTIIKGAQKMVDPPLLMDNDGVITQLKTSPGSVNIQEATSLRENSVRPLVTGGRPDLGIDLVNRKQQNIQSAFHSEVLPLFNSPYMTATQVLELVQQSQRFLSPILGRLQSELLEPMIQRIFGIELRAGRLDPIPEILAGQNISVEYISPIARAQKASDVSSIIETFAVAAEMEAIAPGTADNLDSDAAIRSIADAKGIPVSIVRDANLVAEIRERKQELAAEQRQKQELLETADAASKLIPAIAGAEQAAAA